MFHCRWLEVIKRNSEFILAVYNTMIISFSCCGLLYFHCVSIMMYEHVLKHHSGPVCLAFTCMSRDKVTTSFLQVQSHLLCAGLVEYYDHVVTYMYMYIVCSKG